MDSKPTSPSPLWKFAAFCAAFAGIPASAQPVDEAYGPIVLREIVTGAEYNFRPSGAPGTEFVNRPASATAEVPLKMPLFLTSPAGERRYLFILEKEGRIRVFDREENVLVSEPVLTISPITHNGERGLLGLAFHPDFAENRFFYVNFTDSEGDTIIRRYRMSGTEAPWTAESGSGHDLLKIEQPYANHNGGWIAFGPDGFLYISLGDGGSGNDPLNAGQDKETLLGKMLRIDVNGDDFPEDAARNYAIPADNPFVGKDGRDEIWAYGLRNAWRNSFDRETGDLWMGDVGQNAREEINFQPGGSAGGENYGWRFREGFIATPRNGVGGDRPAGNVDPVWDYPHAEGRSVTGGYVYRGSAMPQLRGHYFFADYVTNKIWSFQYDGEGSVDASEAVSWSTGGNVNSIASFGEDEDGELYIFDMAGGKVFQITQSPWHLWRNRNFSAEEIRDPAISGPAASPRGDGIPNLLKYALGIDLDEATGKLPVEISVETVEGETYLTLKVEREPEATDVDMVVESAGRIGVDADWDDSAVVVVENQPNVIRVRDSVPVSESERRFLRLKVNLATE